MNVIWLLFILNSCNNHRVEKPIFKIIFKQLYQKFNSLQYLKGKILQISLKQFPGSFTIVAFSNVLARFSRESTLELDMYAERKESDYPF